jgi:hypothetical protein
MVFLNAPLISDTTSGGPHVINMKYLQGLVENTTGKFMPEVIGGVLTQTVRGTPKSHIPIIRSKTQAATMGQVPYAGPKY